MWFPLADESAVPVDPGVGAIHDPSSWLDFEAGLVFGAGHDVDIDSCCGSEFAGGWAGIALVSPYLRDVWAVFHRRLDQTRQDCPVLHIGGGHLNG